ncbi:coiled-coil-helix-coiled-coil-helix domain-containing protein 1 isoform X2 [Anabas testudineus]|uniref:coiled-coil-helix-coiled-coil-helix domain-containing protein 1 isoform X2 n=1 Tax=Anabas testudineus TaxID=64144 RepID=UPI000E45E78D|nr:coiled-coil-helix-coiled-coil-helix domain-containing protein 1 isoform X2 [Anabas testudineus]
MAAQGGGVLFQEKVSRLLSKRDGKAVLKPNRPLALRDAVANRKLKKGGETAEDWGLRDVMTPAPKRGHLYHRDVDAHGLLEAEQLCGRPVLRRGEILLHLC